MSAALEVSPTPRTTDASLNESRPSVRATPFTYIDFLTEDEIVGRMQDDDVSLIEQYYLEKALRSLQSRAA